MYIIYNIAYNVLYIYTIDHIFAKLNILFNIVKRKQSKQSEV